MGMFLSYHTPLGKKCYPASQIRLIFFWVFPVIGMVIFFFSCIFCVLIVDMTLFCAKDSDPGLAELLDIK